MRRREKQNFLDDDDEVERMELMADSGMGRMATLGVDRFCSVRSAAPP
jgi:hypothetical protein